MRSGTMMELTRKELVVLEAFRALRANDLKVVTSQNVWTLFRVMPCLTLMRHDPCLLGDAEFWADTVRKFRSMGLLDGQVDELIDALASPVEESSDVSVLARRLQFSASRLREMTSEQVYDLLDFELVYHIIQHSSRPLPYISKIYTDSGDRVVDVARRLRHHDPEAAHRGARGACGVRAVAGREPRLWRQAGRGGHRWRVAYSRRTALRP